MEAKVHDCLLREGRATDLLYEGRRCDGDDSQKMRDKGVFLDAYLDLLSEARGRETERSSENCITMQCKLAYGNTP